MTTDAGPNRAPGANRREIVLAGTAAALTAAIAPAVQAQTPARQGKNVLIINAHQLYKGISEGRLNRSMAALIKDEMQAKGYTVRETVLDAGYSVPEEIQKTLWADVIVTQTPAYWLGTPWIHKKYIDEIFTAAMLDGSFLSGDGRPQGQYGSGGKLYGKRMVMSMTMNAPREAFGDPAQKLFAGRSIDEAYAQAVGAYRFCGVEILPVFAACDVIKNPVVASDFERMKAYLTTHFG